MQANDPFEQFLSKTQRELLTQLEAVLSSPETLPKSVSFLSVRSSNDRPLIVITVGVDRGSKESDVRESLTRVFSEERVARHMTAFHGWETCFVIVPGQRRFFAR